MPRLPAKFSFVLDAKGRLPLGDVDADIRFEASRDGHVHGLSCGRRCAGGELRARQGGRCGGVGWLGVPGSRRRGEGAPRRMRALVERKAPRPVCEAGLQRKPSERSRRRASLHDIMGARDFGAAVVVSAAAAFGELDAIRFKKLIERARALGATGLRLTPWRAFLIVGLDRCDAESLVHSMAELGFIIDPHDPRLRIAACAGAPACAHGYLPVRDDATRWAALLPQGDGVILHVSGCAKGCAKSTATAATFTATAKGYDLILAGRAGDPPARRGLSDADVGRLLAAEGAGMFAAEPRS